ncbi:DUF1702 family protein [Couchioplanes caeruleus]|uniref:DUF1702 family protein n=2 Tax=Couchioplanes caeruleus TaxID=56438 RepID=A0A1K0FTV9_9ACTN|nr:DUF1702 family protein [Couchioplanes caeruleus]OJF16225.1 hypothetical protein BG844_00320 [Couchioplanes caeruleus subsp. caeruleus]ROP28776.1 uncharacterized protein DUF1702 [Couchioplanes caeruleus]
MTGPKTSSRRLGWRRPLVLKHSLVDFQARGFAGGPAGTRATLEAAATSFLDGFNAELATAPDDAPDLSGVLPHHRGLAAEGAAMAATLLDAGRITGTRRTAALHAAYGERYAYLLHVGSGWALAKLRRRRLGRIGAEAPLLRWLAYDGKGFCEAFFATPRALDRWRTHARRCSAVCEIEYQGLGRSLWFRACGDPDRLAALVATMPVHHHADVWSGIALASVYAGGVGADTYQLLAERAADHRAAAAQGAAFGAEAWRLSGFTPDHAATAVPILTGVTPAVAAQWTWTARQGLTGPDHTADDYREWRLRVQRSATATAVGPAGAEDVA